MTVLNSTADEYVRGLIRYVHLAFETQRVVELRRVLRFLGAAYDITDLLAILLATLDDLQAIAAAVAEGSGRDVRHDAFDPDIVIAARVGADVDDQRACAGIAHASKRLASEGVELRFVAPVEFIDRQQRAGVVQQVQSEQLLERLLLERAWCGAAGFDDRVGTGDPQAHGLALAVELPIPEREAFREQLRTQRHRVAIHVRQQLLGNVVR